MNIFTGNVRLKLVIQIFLHNQKPTRRNIMSDSESDYQWEIIHTYSRKEALEDGTLIDIT